MTDDFKELREALDAHPLGWSPDAFWPQEHDDNGVMEFGSLDEDGVKYAIGTVDAGNYGFPEASEGIARLIAAANPSVIRALLSELDAARKDAERYRWLRDVDDDPACSLAQLFTTTGRREDVDAAIDAMKEQQP